MTRTSMDEREQGEPAARPRLLSLQILRGVAACAVVVHHVTLAQASYATGSSWLARSGLGTLGAAGVDLFFILSGFMMLYTSATRKGGKAALSFLRRRAHRILPLYWIWTTILLILWRSKLVFSHTSYRPVYILCSYLLWPIANGSTFHPVLDPGWTLSFEMLFYGIFTASILVATRLPIVPTVLAGLTLLYIAGRAFPATSSMHYLLGNSLLAEFAFGVIAAYIVGAGGGHLPAVPRWLPQTLLLVGITSLLLTVFIGEPQTWRFLIWGLPCFCILLGVVLTRATAIHRVLLYLGDASYSIYLSHFLLVALYATAAKRHLVPHWIPTDLFILLASAAIVAVSSLGYIVLEKPLLQAATGGKQKRPSADARSLQPSHAPGASPHSNV